MLKVFLFKVLLNFAMTPSLPYPDDHLSQLEPGLLVAWPDFKRLQTFKVKTCIINPRRSHVR